MTLRKAAEGCVLVLHGGGGGGTPEELLDDVDGLRAVWQITGATDPRLLAGERALTDPDSGRTLHPTAFSQVNTPVAARLRDHVVELAGDVEGLAVIDAYCGVGAYGQALAVQGARIVGIEQNPASVRAAREAGQTGLRVVEGRVEDHLRDALPADLVIVNPPRTGLATDVTDVLSDDGPARVLYVSCDPATLARDLRRMDRAYSLASVRCFDLFPQTAHVETVAALTRSSAGGP